MHESPPPGRVRLVLFIGVLCVSFPAILVRYAEAPALAIAFWRKALAAGLLVPLVSWQLWRRPGRAREAARLLPLAAATGLVLALHFGTWISSVQRTTVASSLVLASTQPVWGALFGKLFLREHLPPRGAAAILLSLAGVALIAGGDRGLGGESLAGDALAVAAALFAAGYLTLGRSVRARVELAPWLLMLYLAAAAALGLSALAAGLPLSGFSGRTWLMFALLALVPSTLGHNLLNYAVRHMETYKVNLSILAEPVVSTLLAALLFAERPGPLFYPGALLVLAGVVAALWPPRPRAL